MNALFAGILVALQVPQVCPDRARFLHALEALPDGTPQAKVLQALGKPDRIENHGNVSIAGKPIADETWIYGTDGPHGAGTLTRFDVVDGKIAYHPVSASPPPTSVISEAELRKGMHIVLDAMPSDYGNTKTALSAWIVRSVNGLLPFGEVKCKAIIGECGRVLEGYSQLDACPYFLCYSLFDPPQPAGNFRDFPAVWDAPFPLDQSLQPRWPVEIVNNIPIIHGKPVGPFGGVAESFISGYKRVRDQLHMRKSALAPPQ
jgi:hypothetical protein